MFCCVVSTKLRKAISRVSKIWGKFIGTIVQFYYRSWKPNYFNANYFHCCRFTINEVHAIFISRFAKSCTHLTRSRLSYKANTIRHKNSRLSTKLYSCTIWVRKISVLKYLKVLLQIIYYVIDVPCSAPLPYSISTPNTINLS